MKRDLIAKRDYLAQFVSIPTLNCCCLNFNLHVLCLHLDFSLVSPPMAPKKQPPVSFSTSSIPPIDPTTTPPALRTVTMTPLSLPRETTPPNTAPAMRSLPNASEGENFAIYF